MSKFISTVLTPNKPKFAARARMLVASFLLIACQSKKVHAQPVLSANDIYHVVGEFTQSYFRSNIDISVFIGNPGSNFWDFSQPQAPIDVIGRMDVVAVSDGGNGSDFGAAAFALRYAGGGISGTNWEYYALDETNGLVFYGLYEPEGYGVNPSVPNNPPSSILPPSLSYGDSWNVAYEEDLDDPLLGVIPVYYSSTSTVDAYGTIVLPGIGAVPCLRIMEAEIYDYDVFGTRSSEPDTNWLWIAPGIGYAAQVISFAPNEDLFSANLFTNSLSRVFLEPTLAPSPTAGIAVQSNGNTATLSWSWTVNASGYVVQSSTNLNVPQWVPVAQLTNQTWSVPVTTGVPQMFYKIIAQP